MKHRLLNGKKRVGFWRIRLFQDLNPQISAVQEKAKRWCGPIPSSSAAKSELWEVGARLPVVSQGSQSIHHLLWWGRQASGHPLGNISPWIRYKSHLRPPGWILISCTWGLAFSSSQIPARHAGIPWLQGFAAQTCILLSVSEPLSCAWAKRPALGPARTPGRASDI